MRLSFWSDISGEAVDPDGAVVNGDITFHAHMLPLLSEHKSYIFTDADGFLHPENDLTGDELSKAVGALISPEYAAYPDILASLPVGSESLTWDELRGALSLFFADEEIERAAGNEVAGNISRAYFAFILNRLCGRTSEAVSPDSGAVSAVDLSVEDPYYCDILEASVPHSVSGGGKLWSDVSIGTGHAPGMFIIDGCLFCCDDKGYLVRDADIGPADVVPLHFDSDGRYTSGDEQLDAYVSGILSELCREHPDADLLELLRYAYDYMIAGDYGYVGREQLAMSARDWEIDSAKVLFESKLGNCFNYTACFWALARGLGFPADTMILPMDSVNGNHVWAEISFDGIPYIFDPMLEERFSNNRFMLSYDDGGRYGYYHRTHWWLQ